MSLRKTLQHAIRPSSTRSTAALWAKSLLNALLFFCVFMIALPWGAHALLPAPLPLSSGLRVPAAIVLAAVGVAAWGTCLDTFSRFGRGTPLPADAPSRLVDRALFGHLRNPIMAGELLVVWAEALYFGSWGIALYALAISTTAHLSVVFVEEPELRQRFGESYDEYCRHVPRWWPRWRRWSPPRGSEGSGHASA